MPKINLFQRLKHKITSQWRGEGSVNSIFRNMLYLATGTGLGRVIGFISTPIITRIYLPEHMGVLSVFTALVTILVPFGTLRYTMAIPLPKNDGAATNLVVLCSVSILLVSVIVFLFFLLFAAPVLHLLSMEQLLPYWWLLPLAIAGGGFYELLSNWAIRIKAFKPLAKTQVWQSVLGHATKIGLGFAGLKPLGLLIGHILSKAGGVFTLLKNFQYKLKTNIKHTTRKRSLFLLNRYADFPKYRLVSQVILTFGKNVPLLYFAWQFDTETAGHLGLAMMTVALPMSLLGETTSKTFYGEIAKIGKNRPKDIYHITKSITKKLFLISLPPFLILLLLGPSLFEFVFGENWREAGVFASLLTIYLLLQFIYAPIANGVFNVFEKQSTVLSINLIRLIIILCGFAVSYLLEFGAFTSLLIYSISLSIFYFSAIIIIYTLLIKSTKRT